MWNSTLVQLKVNSRGCPSKDRLSLLYLFVYSNSVLSRSSLQRYSNRKMCWINLHVIHMLIGIWYLCLSSLSFNFFIYIAILILGRMDCLESCAQNWIETYHIKYDYCAVLLPHGAGDLLVGALSGLFPSLLLRNTWLWHRFTTDLKKRNIQYSTSNNQHSIPFWISDTRNLVSIYIFHCYMVANTIFGWLFIQLFPVNAFVKRIRTFFMYSNCILFSFNSTNQWYSCTMRAS